MSELYYDYKNQNYKQYYEKKNRCKNKYDGNRCAVIDGGKGKFLFGDKT